MTGATAQFLAAWIDGGVIARPRNDTLFPVSAFMTLLSGLAMSMIRRVN